MRSIALDVVCDAPRASFPGSLDAIASRIGLRVMKTIALADGALAERESALLVATARALGIEDGPSTFEPITPGEARDLLSSTLLRERTLQAAMLVAMMDGEVREVEVETIAAFARAFEIDEPRLRNLDQLSRGHVRRMWLDLARRSFAQPIFEEALRKRGLAGILGITLPMIGLGSDPDLARRYNDLGRLAEGTFGRAYWRFIVDNELGFPGEGVVAEQGVWHDLTHVLAGYGTEPLGEVSVVCFIAGYRKEDPFFWLFTIALQFHLGIKVSPYSPGLVGHFDPEAALHALRRGMAMNRDLSVDYDYWPDLALPLDEVRTRYGVPPP